MPNHYKYVLITPARNEELYIEKTILSVISQSILPNKWVIVSDRSTDQTDEIIKKYSAKYSFIEYCRIDRETNWNFSSKVNAINCGLEKIRNMDYDFIGNLDADISFENNYYKNIMMKFQENIKLGIAGGMIMELSGGKFKTLNYNVNSVAGAIQMFRRSCFEKIGGYLPLKKGGIDAVAEIMARMNGWEVKSFEEIKVYHHRRIGTTNENIYYSRFRNGQRDYSFGTHPLFILLKCIDRFRTKPYIIGSLLTMGGYLWSWIRREKMPVSIEVVEYVRKEQMSRILLALKGAK